MIILLLYIEIFYICTRVKDLMTIYLNFYSYEKSVIYNDVLVRDIGGKRGS